MKKGEAATAGTILLAALAVMCGSSGCGSGGGAKSDAAAGSCAASFTPGASMTWLDDGASECAQEVSAVLDSTATLDLLNIVGSQASGVGIAFGISTNGVAIGGTYTCGDLTNRTVAVSFNYQQGSTPNLVSTCTIDVTSAGGPGVKASGTFSAVVTLTGGGTKTVTNGAFDAPLVNVGG
jgi:hypothetical protein